MKKIRLFHHLFLKTLTRADFKSNLFSTFLNLYLSDDMVASNSPELSIGNLYQTKEIRTFVYNIVLAAYFLSQYFKITVLKWHLFCQPKIVPLYFLNVNQCEVRLPPPSSFKSGWMYYKYKNFQMKNALINQHC